MFRCWCLGGKSKNHKKYEIEVVEPKLETSAIQKKASLTNQMEKEGLCISEAMEGHSTDVIEKKNELAVDHLHIAQSLFKQGKYEESLEHYLKIIDLKTETLGENALEVAHMNYEIGYCLKSLERPEEAILYLEKALTGRIISLGENHEDVASVYILMAEIFHKKNEHRRSQS